MKNHDGGFTLVEVLIAAGLSAILGLVMWRMLRTAAAATYQTDVRIRSDAELRGAMDRIETLLLNANAFTVATSTEVRFISDLNTAPDYAASLDFDGDGFPNSDDPDMDNDATLIQPPTAQWKIGYNLKDDDDDADNQIDMVWKIGLSTRAGQPNKSVTVDYSKNGEPWGGHEQVLIPNVISTGVFNFYGSENEFLSPGATTYDTNNDGLVSVQEIDAPANGGNGTGRIDNAAELKAIVTAALSIDVDANRDGKPDASMSTEIMPPMLYLKRRP